MQGFLEKVAEILEVEAGQINLETDFRSDIDDWDSMKGFSLIVMLEDEYGVALEVSEFLACKTLGDLFARTQR